jgi:ATP-dependent Lhr-like helicase
MLPASFHPLIRDWFTETWGTPTAVQAAAWPLIEQGEHVLALAPTGSGKTLTAFLSAISRFCPPANGCTPLAGGSPQSGCSQYAADTLSVLYVSPLKALNEDIKRNLLEPLAAIRLRFEAAGLPFPAVRVETRSGDTPQADRRRFLTHPPSILAVTPESLAILLLNPRGRQALSTVRYLILDEIHSVLGSKRGAFLCCQIDRLALIAGEFQRISLSATVRPPQAAAELLGGTGRTVRIVAPAPEKQIDFTVEYPAAPDMPEAAPGGRYAALITYILNRVPSGSTTLVFVDSRRRAERLCYLLNEEAQRRGAEGMIAFTHHGSLAKELRRGVERRLAEGSLPCVVATASLELGIDIGSVDEVVLAGSPGSVSQALQRIGRSGHGVGKTSRAKLFPFHGMDLLLAAALAGAITDRDIEESHALENPLDILAQLILALCTERNRNIDELFDTLRGFYVFKDLRYEPYRCTVRMLAGLGERGRLRELKPRIWLDALTGEIGALPGSLLLLYASGGVIASRGIYSLRLTDGTKIGELDEEFVWERRLGDHFDFGGRPWRITAIGGESVEVSPLASGSGFMPFWKADAALRSPVLCVRLLALLDRRMAGAPVPPDACLGEEAAAALNGFLDSQLAAQGGVPLAGSGNITAEILEEPGQAGDLVTVVLHTFRGGAVNYPLALAMAQELEETLRLRVEVFSNDDALLFLIPRMGDANGVPAEELIQGAFASLSGSGGGGLCRGERLFRNRLEASGVFGAQFREAAERSLLLPRAGFGKRTPLWILRQRSKRLFDAAAAEEGFPVTAEAWRSCLADIFDMEGFRSLLDAVNEGAISLSFFRTASPSPFSRDMIRQETNALLYEYDERANGSAPGGGLRSAALSDTVIAEALGDPSLRPRLTKGLTADFTARLRREIPGWQPEDGLSLCEWVKERIAIPLDEWDALRRVLPEPLQDELDRDPGMEGRISRIRRKGAAIASVVHRQWRESWEREALALLGPWLRYEGPVSLRRVRDVFGADAVPAEDAAEALLAVEAIVRDVRVEPDGEALLCDRENLDMLLRLSRKKARPLVTERPAALLAPFLALRQGIALPGGIAPALERLAGYQAPVKLWETEFCTARSGEYRAEAVDQAIEEGRLLWYGAGRERIGFSRPQDLDLLVGTGGKNGGAQTDALSPLFDSGFFDRPRDFWEIHEALGREGAAVSASGCAALLWREVWRGRLSSDSLEALRRGITCGFAPKDSERLEQHSARSAAAPLRHPRIPRALRERWRDGAPVRGRWFSLGLDEIPSGDPLDEACLARDRVRLLVKRYGLLCRPLLEHEAPPLSWPLLLPAIRRMELAGELAAGRFFAGINSLQFAPPAIARELEKAEAFTGLYWMNAADPASLAGLAIEGLDPRLCGRVPGSRLYFRGAELIAVSNRNGKDLRIFISPDDAALAPLVSLLVIPRTRKILPEPKLLVEQINNVPAAASEYAAVFQAAGFVSDRGKLWLWQAGP